MHTASRLRVQIVASEVFVPNPGSPGTRGGECSGENDRISILLIDSDGPVRRDLAGALELAGCCVIANAAVSADSVGIGRLDVALVDVGSGSDGWAHATALRRHLPGLDVVVMSVDRRDCERGRVMGFNWFVEKPFGLGELMDVLRRVVGDRVKVPAV